MQDEIKGIKDIVKIAQAKTTMFGENYTSEELLLTQAQSNSHNDLN